MSPSIISSASSSVASGLLSGRPHYLHWGVIQISLTNFLIILTMLVLFLLALLVPFPQSRIEQQDEEGSDVQR